MSDSPTSYLTVIAEAVSSATLPPVAEWQPAITRDIDMRIDRNGDWFYQGSRIDRARMVRLFASVLRKDAEGIFLVTPQERLRIQVEDAPFTAVLLEQRQAEGEPELVFTTNLGEQVIADSTHAIVVRYADPNAEPQPYLTVRAGLEALISRSVFLELAQLAETRHGRIGVVSRGCFMPLDQDDSAHE